MFPSSSNTAPNSYELLESWRRDFNLHQSAGTLKPLVVPYHFYGLFVLVLYLCIPHTERPWVYAARWPVFLAILAFQTRLLMQTSSMDMGTGFGAGLVSVYSIFWSATWLLWNKPQFDAKRVQWTKKKRQKTAAGAKGTSTVYDEVKGMNGAVATGHQFADSAMTKRVHENGDVKHISKKDGPDAEAEADYYWQSYPDNFGERLSWVMDLVGTQGGERWNWAIPTLPARPVSVRQSLGEHVSEAEIAAARRGIPHVSSVGTRAFSSHTEAFCTYLPKLFMGICALDIIKTCMMNDPYFLFGPNSYDLPPHLFNLNPFLLREYRQLLTFSGIVTALQCLFMLRTLLFLAVYRIPGAPSFLGVRGEAWLHPTQWGSFNSILNKGLNGLWGSWWHQTFRMAFASPTNYLIRNDYIAASSKKTKLISLSFAFAISGLLHAGGSMTQFPQTKPWEPIIFFLLQGVGIIFQTTFCSTFQAQISRIPHLLRMVGNILFTFGWLSLTGNWLVDDFARGGLWLFEPLPVSVLRGLGWGSDGRKWWCWAHIGSIWYTGKHWWESGISLGGAPTRVVLASWTGWLGKWAL